MGYYLHELINYSKTLVVPAGFSLTTVSITKVTNGKPRRLKVATTAKCQTVKFKELCTPILPDWLS